MTAGVHCYDCTCEAMCVGVVSCTYEQWFKLAHVGGIVSFLFLGGACSGFCSLGWAGMACRLLLAVWLVLAMWTGLTGLVWLATLVLLVMRSI